VSSSAARLGRVTTFLGSDTPGESGTGRVLLALAIPAFASIVVYSIDQESWSVLAMSLLVGACAFAVGGLLGFLFGIPQYTPSTAGANDEAGRYAPNTNLTQVSDWLTKIIIGLGLVQFGKLLDAIGDVGDALAPSLGGEPSGRSFAIAVVVGYAVIGFLVGYLYTRLRLQASFRRADRTLEQQFDADNKAVVLASKQLDPEAPSPKEGELKAAIAEASPLAKAQLQTQAQTALEGSPEDQERAKVIIEALEAPVTPGPS
jgi:hypothetical protein